MRPLKANIAAAASQFAADPVADTRPRGLAPNNKINRHSLAADNRPTASLGFLRG